VDPGSADVILDVRPGGDIEFMTRSATGEQTSSSPAAASFPVWLRLARRSGGVTGYTSSDGVSWTTIGNTARREATR
jgi:hypothetical protein